MGAGFNVELGAATVYLWTSPGAFSGIAQAVHIAAYAGEALSVVRSGTRTGGVLTGYIFEDPTGPVGYQRHQLLERADELPAVA